MSTLSPEVASQLERGESQTIIAIATGPTFLEGTTLVGGVEGAVVAVTSPTTGGTGATGVATTVTEGTRLAGEEASRRRGSLWGSQGTQGGRCSI